MTGAGEEADVVLTAVGDVNPVAKPDDESRFSLIFAAPAGRARTDGIRTFSRDGFGAVALYVSPVGPDTEDRPYQAVINRL
jgi:hypothetical protein